MSLHRTITNVVRSAFLISCLILSTPLFAQEFGKNKVQYRNFDWKFIQTAHFDVYFYDEAGQNLATFAAEVAESALVSIQEDVRFRITDRVSIIVYNSHNDFHQTNVVGAFMPEGVGGVTELYKNRVVVPYEGNWETFRHVVHHELVHAVLNDKFYGGSVQQVLSNNIEVQLPIWMNEGLAEFEAFDGYNAETDMFIRDAVIGEYMPELTELDGYFAYRGGQAFYWYVAENYGREKIGELLDRIAVSPSVDAAFRGAFGKDLKEFSEQFLYDLKKLYWPDIADRKRPRDFSRALTSHDKEGSFMNASPSISPDGNLVAFISDRDGPRSVYIMRLDNPEDVRRLVEGERNVEFEELHLLSPSIAWSPDNRRVAMAVKSKGKDVIFLIDVKSGKKERIELDDKMNAIYSVNWSSDGGKLAFQGIAGDMSDIYVYDLKRKELRNITDDIYSDYDPKWAEDGETIYFLSDRRDNPIRTSRGLDYKVWNYLYNHVDVYSVNSTSLDLTRVTNNDEVEKTPTPGPGGSLMYVSDANGIYNIYVVDTPGGTARPITNSITGIEQLTVTPDGSKLVFSAWNGRGYDIFLTRAPFEPTSTISELGKTSFFEGKEKKEVSAEKKEGDSTTYTLVTDVEGYGDVSLDLTDAVTPEPPADRVAAKTFSVPVVPPPGSVTASGDYVVQDYKVKFSTDVIQAGGGYTSFYGVQGLIQGLFSDELGDHSIYAAVNLQLDLTNSDFYLYYNYLAKRIDYEAGVFQNSILLRIGDFGDIARFRQLGASLTASNPFDRFSRLEFGGTFMNVTRENVDGESTLADQSKVMVLPQVRYVFDNSESLIYNPVVGSRYFVSVMGSPKIGSDGVGFYSLLGDFRHYIPLDKWGLTSIAARFSGGASFGPDPQQFFIGGMDGFWLNYDFSDQGLPIANAEDYSLMTPGYPLRGYNYGDQIGSKYAIANVEFRYPLLLFGSGGVLPSLLQFLSGTVFFDAGTAWNDNLNLTTTNEAGKTVTDDLRLGTGLGLRSFILGFPLRLDVAWRYDLESWSKPKYYFSFGADF